jgi:hypothetical protein
MSLIDCFHASPQAGDDHHDHAEVADMIAVKIRFQGPKQ